MNNKMIIIAGPTSSGKTALALKLCEIYGGAIVSADSRQIVKTMDIGTGKTPLTSGEASSKIEIAKKHWIINGNKIYGYDLVTPDEDFSAWHFAQFARNKISELLEKGVIPILVGGTGFYIDATLGKVKLSSKSTSPELRKRLNDMTPTELLEYFALLKIDKKIDMHNRVRIQRAIENHLNLETTETLPELEPVQILEIGLTSGREYLFGRVDRWVDTMWENGLTEETKKLLNRYGEQNSRLNGVVYKTVLAYLKGDLSEEEARQRIKFDLHAYIRRQQTWFKKNQNIVWYDISYPTYPNEIIDHVSNFLKC